MQGYTIKHYILWGGLGLPDIHRYYRAIVLHRILNWPFHTHPKLWVSLEKNLTGRNLPYALWLPWEYRGFSASTSPLTTNILHVWDRFNALYSLVPSGSPLTPIGGFLWFPPEERMAFFGSWADDGNPSCGKFLENSRLIPLETLRDRFGCFPMNWRRHKQLHHFFAAHGGSIRELSTLTPYEWLFIEKELTHHMISELYKLLVSALTMTKSAFIQAWERDLELEFSAEQVTHMYKLTHSSSLESKTQQTNYRLMTHWFWALSLIYPSVTDHCWHGSGQRSTLLHLWGECPVIRPFWLDIKTQIKDALGVDVPGSLPPPRPYPPA